ncbi:cysteine/glutathione ABC transporter ATP-binding protein/permease CydC, partial [Escherichia coli]
LEFLAEMMREKTVFLVTHRLRGLSRFLQILVMDNGQIIEQGTHAVLLARQGRYYQFKQGV